MEKSVGIEMVLLPEATFFLTIFFNKGRPSHNALITFFLTIFL
jgi:F0F1-type ATP synthase assembly protein I